MSSVPDWDDSLDAVRAAPSYHHVLLENDFVRVLDTRINPGERTPVHTHRSPAVHYVVSWSAFVRRDAEGNVLLDTRALPKSPDPVAVWSEPLGPHSLENVGSLPIHIISTEIKAHSNPRSDSREGSRGPSNV